MDDLTTTKVSCSNFLCPCRMFLQVLNWMGIVERT